MKPQFTTAWQRDVPAWEEHLARFRGQQVQALEIGSFEGRSACWLLEHVLTHPSSALTCVDPHRYVPHGGEAEHEAAHYNEAFDLDQVKRRFVLNTQAYGRRLRHFPETSYEYLRGCRSTFHFALVDGSHAALPALTDLVLVWPLLHRGGVLIFDDVGWRGYADNPGHGPRQALAAFTSCCPDARLLHRNYVAILEKP